MFTRLIKLLVVCTLSVGVLTGCGAPDGSSENTSVNVGNGTGSALVSWLPPTENTDGSSLTDLAEYRIYYGNSPGSYDNSVTIDKGLSSFQVEGLGPSDTYFVMTAVNAEGIESAYSEEVYKRIE